MDGDVLVLRTQVADVGEAQLRRKPLAIVQRLAEQHAGVEEEDSNVGVDLRGHVQQHRRLRPERGHQRQPVAVPFDRRAQDLLRAGVAQLKVQRVDRVERLVGSFIGHQSALPSARSAKIGSRASAAR